MYFTFSEESVYGLDSTSQDYVADLVSDEVIDNINYEKNKEFTSGTNESRTKRIKSIDGRVGLELTYGNLGWNILFKTLMGQKINLPDLSLAQSSEKWNIITGMLAADLSVSGTSFIITEYKSGEFDNVVGVIINSEYIVINAIAGGVVTSSTRGQIDTTAVPHNQNALVYGVVNSGGQSIDIISRYRNGFCYQLPTSLTCMIYRAGDYFTFTGVQFSDFVLNLRPTEGITASFNINGRDSKVVNVNDPSTATDENVLTDTDHVNCYSMNVGIDIAKFYFEISNTLQPGKGKFLDSTLGKMFLKSFSTYGQFSAVSSDISYYQDYIDDVGKNLSITICNDRKFTKAYVLSFNDLKWGTMQHILRTTRLIHDSIPFYCYGSNSFNILIQN